MPQFEKIREEIPADLESSVFFPNALFKVGDDQGKECFYLLVAVLFKSLGAGFCSKCRPEPVDKLPDLIHIPVLFNCSGNCKVQEQYAFLSITWVRLGCI